MSKINTFVQCGKDTLYKGQFWSGWQWRSFWIHSIFFLWGFCYFLTKLWSRLGLCPCSKHCSVLHKKWRMEWERSCSLMVGPGQAICCSFSEMPSTFAGILGDLPAVCLLLEGIGWVRCCAQMQGGSCNARGSSEGIVSGVEPWAVLAKVCCWWTAAQRGKSAFPMPWAAKIYYCCYQNFVTLASEVSWNCIFSPDCWGRLGVKAWGDVLCQTPSVR